MRDINHLNGVPDKESGGAKGSRTPDLLNAIQALSQLSYGPTCSIDDPFHGLPWSGSRGITICHRQCNPPSGNLLHEASLRPQGIKQGE